MGKWAQSRKRGGGGPPKILLEAPPAPTLYAEDTNLYQGALGGDDTGGHIRLQTSNDGLTGWAAFDAGPWTAIRYWGDTGNLPAVFFRCLEDGNGSYYAGTSPPSNVYDNT